MFLLGMIVFMAVGVLFYGLIAKVGYDMFRKMNPTTVANFAFIFSLLTAHLLYHLLPTTVPNFIAAHVGKGSPLFGQGSAHGIDYRFTLSFIAS